MGWVHQVGGGYSGTGGVELLLYYILVGWLVGWLNKI